MEEYAPRYAVVEQDGFYHVLDGDRNKFVAGFAPKYEGAKYGPLQLAEKYAEYVNHIEAGRFYQDQFRAMLRESNKHVEQMLNGVE